MLSIKEARARVARGAAHLDRVRPGWAQQIDVGTLTMHNSALCIVGQLTGGTYAPYSKLQIKPPEGTELYGFLALDLDGSNNTFAEYDLLQDVWIETIAARLRDVPKPQEPVEAPALVEA